MKIVVLGAAIVGVFLLYMGATTGTVADKRAPGQPGDKVFQLQVDGPLLTRWVTVSDRNWDRCSMYEPYPDCVG